MKMKVMFVCTANTCRSAMAEAIFKQMVGDKVDVYSSGIFAETGRSASKNSQEACKSHGIDLSNHTATNFRDSDIARMDLVLTATEYHKIKLRIYYPNLEIYTIREYAGEYPYDIDDPVGGTLEGYNACFEEIYKTLEKVVVKLKEKL
jgi:protein-tyrosine-phosphatase